MQRFGISVLRLAFLCFFQEEGQESLPHITFSLGFSIEVLFHRIGQSLCQSLPLSWDRSDWLQQAWVIPGDRPIVTWSKTGFGDIFGDIIQWSLPQKESAWALSVPHGVFSCQLLSVLPFIPHTWPWEPHLKPQQIPELWLMELHRCFQCQLLTDHISPFYLFYSSWPSLCILPYVLWNQPRRVFIHLPSASATDSASHPSTQLSPRDTVHELPSPDSSPEKGLIQLLLTRDLPLSEGTRVPKWANYRTENLFTPPSQVLAEPSSGLPFQIVTGFCWGVDPQELTMRSVH